ncbi:Uu.00g018220.m01.CDS01 [Anthostomella pinea]|uniref:Uu.00g018220.m01.CDS01 n=1 Tax=Anthostomella pinea TaxID=933095 RepID=A0AAI8VZ22_9PEZI|nr:Uu.00g018220.m01.CDS01 [Anthostomella pinea]
MQTPIRCAEQSYVPLGQRRGKPDLACFALDLTRARAETDCAPGSTRAYPSPPMSGSPPPPPKPNQEVGDRGQGGYQASNRDVYRTGSTLPGGEYRAAPPPPLPHLPPPPPPGVRPYTLETPERMPYQYRRPEDTMGRPMSYPPQPGHMAHQPNYPLPPVAGPTLMPSPYPISNNPHGPENPAFASPKSQRKTKGHVASACVPCKRAHLRCDAQRPCSRCLSNGKEDACVDVQHKKRGRPRLRDDREPRFDAGRFAQPVDPTMRRPLSLYSPANVAPAPFDDPLRRSQSYRILKSQPSDPTAPRFIERGSAADANVYPPPLSIAPRAPEPVAFLTTDLEVAKASSTFLEAIGIDVQSMMGRRLSDVIAAPERERVHALQRALQDEQGRKEPNYLPPIFGKQEAERVIQALPFSPESLSRYQLDRPDFFTFVSADGQPRPYPIRIGLAKEDSIYFVVLLLCPPTRPFPHPSPSPHARDLTYSFQPQGFAQLTPVSASFDQGRSRFGEMSRESSYTPRQPPTPGHFISGPSPGMSPNVSSYSASATARPEQRGSISHQIPRSELLPARQPPQPEYQLPPIRSQPQTGPPVDTTWPRDDRTGRVDIGGLIDKPGPSRRNQ